MGSKKKDKDKLKMRKTTIANLGRAAGGTSPVAVESVAASAEAIGSAEAAGGVSEAAASAARGGGLMGKISDATNILTLGGGGGGGSSGDKWSGHKPSATASHGGPK
jgi:hypothetical protein